MFIQLLIGTGMILLTVVFQALSLDFLIRKLKWFEHQIPRRRHALWKAFALSMVVLGVSCVLIAEIWMWGLLYFSLGVVLNLETALYFSTATFTTVGYGDVILGADWRLLSSVEALNGFLLFGWSTAFIFEIVSRVYIKEGKAIEG